MSHVGLTRVSSNFQTLYVHPLQTNAERWLMSFHQWPRKLQFRGDVPRQVEHIVQMVWKQNTYIDMTLLLAIEIGLWYKLIYWLGNNNLFIGFVSYSLSYLAYEFFSINCVLSVFLFQSLYSMALFFPQGWPWFLPTRILGNSSFSVTVLLVPILYIILSSPIHFLPMK